MWALLLDRMRFIDWLVSMCVICVRLGVWLWCRWKICVVFVVFNQVLDLLGCFRLVG